MVRRTTVKGIVCVLLILPGLGCRSVYRFRCTSRPAGAVVLVGQEMMGETACSFKIPKKSRLVQGDQIEFTFCLPDGREKKRVVELRRVKATNPVAEVFAAPFLLAGVGLFALFHGDPDHEDPPSPSESQDKNDHGGLTGTLLGLGFLGIGAGAYALLGGDAESLSDYPIWVDFNEPPDAGGPRTPATPPEKEHDPERVGEETTPCGMGILPMNHRHELAPAQAGDADATVRTRSWHLADTGRESVALGPPA